MFIYAIASGPETVKIGYSANPERRLGELQVGHEKRLRIVYKEQVPEDKAPLLEKLIHKANRHLRIHGEWFALTHEQATREVQFAIIRYLED
jgi:hypothetical protein